MGTKNKKLFDLIFLDILCLLIFIVGLVDSAVNNCCWIRFFGILLLLNTTISTIINKILKK